jgi:hypothetical protein
VITKADPGRVGFHRGAACWTRRHLWSDLAPEEASANRALELLGRELNLFTEKKEVGKPGDFDHMSDEELIQFIEAQGEVVRELERQLLPPPAPKQRKSTTKH